MEPTAPERSCDPNAPRLGGRKPSEESPAGGGCNAGTKMQARRLRYGRPPPTAAFAAHDRHPVAQASRLLFWNEEP